MIRPGDRGQASNHRYDAQTPSDDQAFSLLRSPDRNPRQAASTLPFEDRAECYVWLGDVSPVGLHIEEPARHQNRCNVDATRLRYAPESGWER